VELEEHAQRHGQFVPCDHVHIPLSPHVGVVSTVGEVAEIVGLDRETSSDERVEPVLVVLEPSRSPRVRSMKRKIDVSRGVIDSRSSLIGHQHSKCLSVVCVG